MLPSKIASALYWSLQHLNGKSSLAAKLKFLEGTQWLSRAELVELTFRKLESLLKHCYETVPYYHEVMKARGFNPNKLQSFDDLQRLPILTREILAKNFEKLKSSEISSFHAHESCSSGSTGQPARFMQDINFDTWCRAHQLRAYHWCGGWKVGERFALIWGSPVYWDKQTLARRVEAAFTNRIELNCNNIGRSNLERILDRLSQFQPKLISGYSTALYLLCQLARERGVRLGQLQALQPNAEPTYDYMRKEMEDYFKVPVFDKYGSTETNIISHQSVVDNSIMCIQSENTHVEFINDNGFPCKNGEDGNLIATTLNNYSMPLIRYQTLDVAAPLEGLCPSGRGFPLMSKIRGRLYDVILTKKGEKVHPQIFSNLFSNFSTVQWFQVVQDEVHTLDIHLLTHDQKRTELEKTFLKMINLRTGGDFSARFHYVSSLPQTKTGKHKLCVCNLSRSESHAI